MKEKREKWSDLNKLQHSSALRQHIGSSHMQFELKKKKNKIRLAGQLPQLTFSGLKGWNGKQAGILNVMFTRHYDRKQMLNMWIKASMMLQSVFTPKSREIRQHTKVMWHIWILACTFLTQDVRQLSAFHLTVQKMPLWCNPAYLHHTPSVKPQTTILHFICLQINYARISQRDSGVWSGAGCLFPLLPVITLIASRLRCRT